jgi:hypothetical protein
VEEKRFGRSPAVLRVYEGSVRFEAPVEVEAAVAAGPRTIHGQLRHQGSTPPTCLMPATQPVEVELEISQDKSCNNEKQPEGECDANRH